MAGKERKKNGGGNVIVRKEDVVQGGHHGGAWKVAYADFVTAMMAFFLLMWLLNATTETQRKGLADYFSPSNLLSHASSGSGQPFGGHTPFDSGAMASDRGAVQVIQGRRPASNSADDGADRAGESTRRSHQADADGHGPVPDDMDQDQIPDPRQRGQSGQRQAPGPGGPMTKQHDGLPVRQPGDVDLAAALRLKEKASFEAAAQQIQAAVRNDPALADLAKQLKVDVTPQGLSVQIMDEVKVPMFTTGSAIPNDRTKALIQKIVPVLIKLNKGISIAGHTDAAPFPGPGRTNWDLSAERANATRRLLEEGGLPDARIRSVTGLADRDPLIPSDPLAAANRRISILVLPDAPVVGNAPATPAPAPAH